MNEKRWWKEKNKTCHFIDHGKNVAIAYGVETKKGRTIIKKAVRMSKKEARELFDVLYRLFLPGVCL